MTGEPPAASPASPDDPGAGYAVVAAVRGQPDRALVALDFDGTLSPISADPEQSRLVEGAREVLVAMLSAGVQVCLVSGRAAADVVRLGGLADVAGLRVLGHYGLQEWSDGRVSSPDPDPGVAVVRERLPGLLADAPDGVTVEDKHLALVVHTRRASDPQRVLDDLTARLEALADEAGLETVMGRYVVELRPGGIDKGSVLRRLVEQSSPSVVVYAGDDLGDLPAFEVIRELRDTGDVLGLTVASVTPDEDVPDVARQADVVVAGPAGVVDFLRRLAG